MACAVCPRTFERSGLDWFYSFHAGPPAQERSLLMHMEPVRNRHLRRFSAPVNRAQMRAALASCDRSAVLDVGCGAGRSWSQLEEPFHYYGLEPSPVPEPLRSPEPPPDHVILIHNDPAKPLPVAAASFTVAAFIASYDHIPDREEVLRQAWECLRPGGHMVFYMTNYGFWAKRMANALLGRQTAKHEREHYCVHSVETLESEVISVCPGARLVDCRSDYFWIPNTPLHFLYRSKLLLHFLNSALRIFVRGILRMRNAGAVMICVFEKSA